MFKDTEFPILGAQHKPNPSIPDRTHSRFQPCSKGCWWDQVTCSERGEAVVVKLQILQETNSSDVRSQCAGNLHSWRASGLAAKGQAPPAPTRVTTSQVHHTSCFLPPQQSNQSEHRSWNLLVFPEPADTPLCPGAFSLPFTLPLKSLFYFPFSGSVAWIIEEEICFSAC